MMVISMEVMEDYRLDLGNNAGEKAAPSAVTSPGTFTGIDVKPLFFKMEGRFFVSFLPERNNSTC